MVANSKRRREDEEDAILDLVEGTPRRSHIREVGRKTIGEYSGTIVSSLFLSDSYSDHLLTRRGYIVRPTATAIPDSYASFFLLQAFLTYYRESTHTHIPGPGDPSIKTKTTGQGYCPIQKWRKTR